MPNRGSKKSQTLDTGIAAFLGFLMGMGVVSAVII
jgi:hypothetical protein